MASSARKYEAREAEKVEVPFSYKRPVEPGSRVAVHYSTDGKTWQTADLPEKGGHFEGTIEMDEGDSFQFKYRIEKPDGTVDWYPVGGPETNMRGIAQKGPEASPSPSEPVKEVRSRLQGKVAGILEAAKEHDSAAALDLLFEELQDEIDTLGMTGDQSAFLLEVTLETLAEMDGIPRPIRDSLRKGGKRPSTYDELRTRLEQGSAAYQRAVFRKIFSDSKAREFFHLESSAFNPAAPLGSPKYNELFTRICAKHGDVSGLAPHLGVALASVANVSARNPALAARRRLLMDQVAARLKEDDANFLDGVPAERKAKIGSMLFQGAVLTGAFATGTIVVPALMLAAKGLLKAATGVGEADLIRYASSPDAHTARSELGKVLAANNIARQAFKTKQNAAAVVRGRLKEVLWELVPFSPLFRKSRPKDAVGDVHAEGIEDAGLLATAESHIEKACQQAA